MLFTKAFCYDMQMDKMENATRSLLLVARILTSLYKAKRLQHTIILMMKCLERRYIF